MNSDDSSRNMNYSHNRKPNSPNKSHGYSPSSNYNYNYNGNQSSHSNHGNSNYNNQQHHQRRKPNQYKRDNHGASDRLAKQNDIIIRLLKEIRDRLPPPPVDEKKLDEEAVAEVQAETSAQNAEPAQPDSSKEDESLSEKEIEPQAVAVTEKIVDEEELDQKVNGNV